MMRTQKFAIKDIYVPVKRRTTLNPKTVHDIAESILEVGLKVPILVREDGARFVLVEGLHRLEACKSIGFTEIEASVVQLDDAERELWEIDENLCRADLTELERGEHLLRRKEIYQRKWPATRQGGDRRSEEFQTDNLSVRSFAAVTADKIGATDRDVRRTIRRASKIDEKVRARVRALPEIADSGVELDALANLEPAQQKRAVALFETGQAHGIRAAKKLMRPTTTINQDAARQKRRDAFLRAWKALDDDDRKWARRMMIQ